jgi:hypothetical protein
MTASIASLFDLAGTVSVITGAGRGIGLRDAEADPLAAARDQGNLAIQPRVRHGAASQTSGSR